MGRSAAPPLVSVIVGAHNCAGTLGEAIGSLLGQTWEDWELILCDDGSTDETFAVAERYQRQRPDKITLLRNERSRGLACALNRCLEQARGKYIARMDGDDRCDGRRLALELQALEAEPGIAVVSTDMECFDETGVWGRVSHPASPTRKDFLRGTPFCHAACMVRREALDAVGGYSEDETWRRVEDYHLWVRLYAAGFSGRNIPLPLYQAREDKSAYRRRKLRYRVNEARVRTQAVRELGLPGYGYLYALRPLLVGLLPPGLYERLHRKKLSASKGRRDL